jgi:CheY-like chemotaxis protein
VVDINRIVADMERMLRPLVGEAVELVVTLAHPLAGVATDRGPLEQAIINLALNARDAMPDGGRLSIRTSNVVWAEGEAYGRVGIDIPHGAYVMLVVADTGLGMDAATRGRIFEPFFSTKPASRNTGLGLATVYGIVSQSGGYVWVESVPGKGSTFYLCFPAAGTASGEELVGAAPPARGGSETILLVEDEQAVRTLAARALREQGYRVLSAEHGRAALVHLESEPDIDLLISDVVMPEMGGVDLAERTRGMRPGLPILLISGYTDSDSLRRGISDSGLPFLQKPFSPESLLRRVRELLDARTVTRPRD